MEGTLKNPNLLAADRMILQEGVNDANEYLNRIEELFEPYGGIE